MLHKSNTVEIINLNEKIFLFMFVALLNGSAQVRWKMRLQIYYSNRENARVPVLQ